jgi:hypothetical protein
MYFPNFMAFESISIIHKGITTHKRMTQTHGVAICPFPCPVIGLLTRKQRATLSIVVHTYMKMYSSCFIMRSEVLTAVNIKGAAFQDKMS